MDFYKTWLGIPPERRPPTYYDLLGLALFESDSSTIDKAALRRMAMIREYQIGPFSDHSQDILSELARARLILIDTDRRAEYDDKLRARGESRISDSGISKSDGNGDVKRDPPGAFDVEPDVFNGILVAALDVEDSLSLRATPKNGISWWHKGLALVAAELDLALLVGTFAFLTIVLPSLNQKPPKSVRHEPASALSIPILTRPLDRPAVYATRNQKERLVIPMESRPLDRPAVGGQSGPAPINTLRFDGRTRILVAGSRAFDMTNRDYTIFARIKTSLGGTIFSRTAPERPWAPDAKALYIADGRLAFDIGQVGKLESRAKVADDTWHELAMTYARERRQVRLFIDGTSDCQKFLAPKRDAPEHVVRIGYSPGYPHDLTYFFGQISEVRFYARALNVEEIRALATNEPAGAPPVARWILDPLSEASIPDQTGHGHEGTPEVGTSKPLVGRNPRGS